MWVTDRGFPRNYHGVIAPGRVICHIQITSHAVGELEKKEQIWRNEREVEQVAESVICPCSLGKVRETKGEPPSLLGPIYIWAYHSRGQGN